MLYAAWTTRPGRAPRSPRSPQDELRGGGEPSAIRGERRGCGVVVGVADLDAEGGSVGVAPSESLNRRKLRTDAGGAPSELAMSGVSSPAKSKKGSCCSRSTE